MTPVQSARNYCPLRAANHGRERTIRYMYQRIVPHVDPPNAMPNAPMRGDGVRQTTAAQATAYAASRATHEEQPPTCRTKRNQGPAADKKPQHATEGAPRQGPRGPTAQQHLQRTATPPHGAAPAPTSSEEKRRHQHPGNPPAAPHAPVTARQATEVPSRPASGSGRCRPAQGGQPTRDPQPPRRQLPDSAAA